MKRLQLILIFISGIAKAFMDTLQFHFDRSIASAWNKQFWDASISWVNQHNTWLPAFLTDGWHLSQFFFLESIFIAIVIYKPIINISTTKWLNTLIDFLILRLIFGAAFVMFYNYLLLK